MLKNFFQLILSFILVIFLAAFPAQVLAMTLTDLGKLDDFSSRAGKNYLYSDLGTGERVCFSLDEVGVLHLLGSKGQDYLSFILYDTRGAEGLTYQVKKLQLDHLGRQFWQITAFAGIHEMNCGYWLVGKVGERYMAFVSLSNLASLGYTPDSWHSLHSKVEGERLILT